jgi:DNA-binding beta-propeller fold protein YncE
MKISKKFITSALAALAVTLPVSAADDANHEVWMLDQSNTYDSDGNGSLDSGGTLYIYNGDELTGQAASPQKIDLGGVIAEQTKLITGTAPVRPHYLTLNRSHTHAIVSFVASGHVLIFDAATRTPLFAADVGAQAHAAVPSPDETYILVANQNGKLLQRINTDYMLNAFVLDTNATLDLAAGTTPSGALKQDDGVAQTNVRPDTAPILALPDATSTLAFVTLRGGGLFVVNPRVSPMEIVGEFTKTTIQPAGLLAEQSRDTLYFNSGGGGGSTLGFQSFLYRLPVSAFSTTPNPTPDSPAPVVVFDHTARTEKDSHGLILTKDQRYLWAADRAANSVIVVDTATHAVVNEINLAGAVSADPGPDLLALSPSGNCVYVTLRGPIPLTGNNTNVNNAKGSTPGLGIIRVEQAGMTGTLQARFDISNLDGVGVERADPHGIAVRSTALTTTIRASQVEVCWNSTSNLTYQVQYRSVLTTNLWAPLVDCFRSTSSKSCVSDPVVMGQPQRFYRVVQTNCIPSL